AHEFLKKHGLSAVFFSRFFPVVRTFLPIVAGMVRMKDRDFVKDSLLACLIWSAVFTLAGYYFGKGFPQTERYLTLSITIVVVISILPGVFHFLKKKK